MQSPLNVLLNLPGVTVEGYSVLEGYICIHLTLLEPGIKCPRCGSHTKELHQVRPTLIRDLPSFGQPVYLKVPRRQFYCRSCQKYVTEQLEFVELRARHTKRYEENIYQRVLHSNLEQVSREEGISAEEVEKIFNSVSQVKKKIGVK